MQCLNPLPNRDGAVWFENLVFSLLLFWVIIFMLIVACGNEGDLCLRLCFTCLLPPLLLNVEIGSDEMQLLYFHSVCTLFLYVCVYMDDGYKFRDCDLNSQFPIDLFDSGFHQ